MLRILRNVINKSSLLKWIKLRVFRLVWRQKNKENYTIASNCFSLDKVLVGRGTYGDLFIKHFGNENERLTIGSYCSIAPCVTFILGGEHNYSSLMTYPIRNKLINGENESITKGEIIIGDDVWIGYGATILSGVKIGQGAVIAAGSMVYKDVPPYAIYATNRIIKYRFEKEIREKLSEIEFSRLGYNDITRLYKKFDGLKVVNRENIELIVNDIKREFFRSENLNNEK